MKTTIYDLLGMIKNDIFVKRILFRNQVYEYDEDGKDYYNEEYGWIFDGYSTLSILNEPIEILETTITYKQENRQDKIKKINIIEDLAEPTNENNIRFNFVEITDKINEIIEVLNAR